VLADPRPYGTQYRRIVEVLTEAGRHAEALDWAERGLVDAGVRMNDSVVEFVATRYAADGRAGDVLALRRTHFERTRRLGTYQSLRDAALAVDDWPATREWALAQLRTDRHVLVDVLLWEESTEEAWAAAQRYGAGAAQWLRLAHARAANHPADSIGVYRRLAEEKVELRDNQAYEEAAELVVRVKALYQRLGQDDQLASYLAELRRSHKPKRNFMAALTRHGLTS
jgi:uncharacterized Zn finger protein